MLFKVLQPFISQGWVLVVIDFEYDVGVGTCNEVVDVDFVLLTYL
jgi:hypothetical protein